MVADWQFPSTFRRNFCIDPIPRLNTPLAPLHHPSLNKARATYQSSGSKRRPSLLSYAATKSTFPRLPDRLSLGWSESLFVPGDKGLWAFVWREIHFYFQPDFHCGTFTRYQRHDGFGWIGGRLGRDAVSPGAGCVRIGEWLPVLCRLRYH